MWLEVVVGETGACVENRDRNTDTVPATVALQHKDDLLELDLGVTRPLQSDPISTWNLAKST